MRDGKNYSADKIAALETIVANIYKEEPAGSSLVPRAVESLIEAYSAGKDSEGQKLHSKTIALAQKVLDGQAGFVPTPRLRAVLYLRWAEAASWSQAP